MNSSIQAGFFLGVDDCPGSPIDSVSGSVSASALKSEFEGAFPSGDWRLVVSDDITLLTRNEILDRLRRFLIERSNAGTLLLYFAGHGCSFEGRYLFCPRDFRQELPHHTGIGVDVLSDLMSRYGAQTARALVIFDTCRVSLDKSRKRAEPLHEGCTVVFTCKFGGVISDIQGLSDFVKSFRAFAANAALQSTDETVQSSFQELLDFVDGRRERAGTGVPISIEQKGARVREQFYSKGGLRPVHADCGAINITLESFPKSIATCNKRNGEILHKISNALGIPPDPGISMVTDVGADLGRLTLRVPIAQPLKSATLIEYIIFQFPGLFIALTILLTGAAVPRLASQILEDAGFLIWLDSDEYLIANRSIGPVVAKVEICRSGENWSVELRCVGQLSNDGWGLDRYDYLLAQLLKQLFCIGS